MRAGYRRTTVFGGLLTAVGGAGHVRDDHRQRRGDHGYRRDDYGRERRGPVDPGPGEEEKADARRHQREVPALVDARRLRTRVVIAVRHERRMPGPRRLKTCRRGVRTCGGPPGYVLMHVR